MFFCTFYLGFWLLLLISENRLSISDDSAMLYTYALISTDFVAKQCPIYPITTETGDDPHHDGLTEESFINA